MNEEILLGLNDNSVIYSDLFGVFLHPEIIKPLELLYLDALTNGFDLVLASGYRSYSRQLAIWNEKARGVRPVLNSSGNRVNILSMSDDEKLWAILRWSALPGASRHHWGTDFDLYDKSRIDENYQPQLTVAETESPGPFAEFHLWLTRKLNEKDCPFFRPYAVDRGGIAPEPWHLSYAPVAHKYYSQLSVDLFKRNIEQTEIELKDSILRNINEIFERFIKINE